MKRNKVIFKKYVLEISGLVLVALMICIIYVSQKEDYWVLDRGLNEVADVLFSQVMVYFVILISLAIGLRFLNGTLFKDKKSLK